MRKSKTTERKRIVVLGSTGSIGSQTLEVIEQHQDRFELVGIAAGRNRKALLDQVDRFKVKKYALFESDDDRIPSGISAIEDLAVLEGVDIVVVSVSGVIGLRPTIAAIQAKKNIALASKEVLVAAGELVMPLIRKAGITITPIDSEHSAIFQCLQGINHKDLLEIIITASGGPFRGQSRDFLNNISVQEALQHPTWSMGAKITIDSATLMNKALEIIEASWLFNVPMHAISAVIHPQSIVHSCIKVQDGSVIAQLGWPNMRLPILYALSFPSRVENSLKQWSPVDSPNLTFEPIDNATFPSINIARRAMELGGAYPCAFNAANEQAVSLFLKGKISLLQIFELVQAALESSFIQELSLEHLIQVDKESRIKTLERASALN